MKKLLLIFTIILIYSCNDPFKRAIIIEGNYPIIIQNIPNGLNLVKHDTIWTFYNHDKSCYEFYPHPILVNENIFIPDGYERDTLQIPPTIYYKAVIK